MARDKREEALDAALARQGIDLPARHRAPVLRTVAWLDDGLKTLRAAYPEDSLPPAEGEER